jgi:hypothetical protein
MCLHAQDVNSPDGMHNDDAKGLGIFGDGKLVASSESGSERHRHFLRRLCVLNGR